MSSQPNTSGELWAEIESVDLNCTLPLTKEGTTRHLKSNWILRVEAVDPTPCFKVHIANCKYKLKFEEVIVSGTVETRAKRNLVVPVPVHAWSGPEKVKSSFSTAKSTMDPTITNVSVIVKYRRKIITPKSKSPFMDSLSSHLKDLFLSSDGSDVVFEIESEEISAHKILLSARVPYFKSLFASGMEESETKRIRVEEFSAKAFKQFLKLIYSGQLPDDMEEDPGVYLPLAEKYGMEDFKKACVKSMMNSLTSENVVSTFIAADLFRCPRLKSECLSVVECEGVPKPSLGPLKEYPSLMFELIERLALP